jgi:hypothetical protein
MRVTSGKSRVRESRPPGSVRAKPNGRATRPLTRRRRVGQLVYGVGDAAPYCLAVVIVLRRKFIGARGAFLDGLVAIPPEHQVGGARQISISGIMLETL